MQGSPPGAGTPPPAALLSRAMQLYRAGDLAAAERLCRDVLRIVPDHPDAAHGLAIILARTGRAGEAETLLRRIVQQAPAFAAAAVTLGILLRKQSRLDHAIAVLRQAHGHEAAPPDVAQALADTYVMAGRFDDAAAVLRDLVANHPDRRHAHVALAEVEMLRRNTAAAASAAQACVDRFPDDARAWLTLGFATLEQGRNDAALDMFARARSLAPDNELAQIAPLAATLPLIPESAAVAAGAYERFVAGVDALTRRYEAASPDVLRSAAGAASHIDTFILAYRDHDITPALAKTGALFARLQQARFRPPPSAPPRADGKIRVGIVSGFFQRRHPVWKGIVSGWASRLDRGRFEVIGYATGSLDPSDDAVIRAAFDRVAGPFPSVEAWIAAIAADRPDVLVYPDGPLENTSRRLSALRLAPVQCATWGHPTATGLPTIDAYLSADALEPADADGHYPERLVRLANLGVYYEPETEGVTPKDRAWFGEADGVPLVGCVQSLFKYLPEHDGLLPRIAAAAGPCRFVFFEDGDATATDAVRRRLEAAFAARGLRFDDWCRFLPRVSPTEFYAIVGGLDVCLDAPGFSGFNTAMEAASQDVPVVTLRGGFLRSRLAAGILDRMGVAETVADDVESYVGLAARLIADPAYRQAVSARIAAGKARAWRDGAAIASLEACLSTLVEGAR